MTIDQSYPQFLQFVLSGNRSDSANLIKKEAQKTNDIKQIHEEYLKKAMYEVGDLWEMGKISVATEHMASAIVENILNDLYFLMINQQITQKKVVLSCIEDELHQIGIKMVSHIFELNGWETYFLGANTPSSDLIKFIEEHKPSILALSLSIYFHLPILDKMIAQVRAHFPELFIVIGGQAFRHGGLEMLKKYNNLIYLSDLHSIDQFLKK